MVCENCRNTHEVSVPFLRKLQKHARSKCAVFAPLLRAGFRNFFANHFPFGIATEIFNLTVSVARYTSYLVCPRLTPRSGTGLYACARLRGLQSELFFSRI
jgi:hypothetical protein